MLLLFTKVCTQHPSQWHPGQLPCLTIMHPRLSLRAGLGTKSFKSGKACPFIDSPSNMFAQALLPNLSLVPGTIYPLTGTGNEILPFCVVLQITVSSSLLPLLGVTPCFIHRDRVKWSLSPSRAPVPLPMGTCVAWLPLNQ